jgi:predicted MFS family arabinose efflux permease
MHSPFAPAPAPIGTAQQHATRVAFFIAGFAIAAWAPLVPFVQARLGLDARGLGLVLLCLGLGSMLAMPLAGALTARFGCRQVLAASTLVACLAFPFLVVVENHLALALALFVFGAGIGCLDCAINIQAIIVERAAGRPMMSGFHGLFSVGGIAGASGVSLMLLVGATPLLAALVVVGLILLALSLSMPATIIGERRGQSSQSGFAWPRGVVLLIGALCFVLFLAEGALLDWSAVFLTSVRGVDPAQAGFGYAAFAAAMTLGRLLGDRVVGYVGAGRIIVLGSLIAALGFLLATLLGDWRLVLCAYALVGLGCSNVVPVLYSATGRQRVMPESQAVSAVTTLGYSGILLGPAAIGFAAQATSLSVAFGGIAMLLALAALAGSRLRA